MMVILWFSQCTVQLCSYISDEHTASIFTMTELVSNGYQVEAVHPSQMSACILSTKCEHPTKKLSSTYQLSFTY
jgi:predicted CoA-binding protein